MARLPKQFERFRKEAPEIAKAYEALGQAVHGAGHLELQTRCLIKL
jgi:alkylhydroperoxidase/carboxymuconolactone decarboxylase family protein YurZ